jgi:asparagine synthase (glutamine-hydrolysing)
MCGIAGFLTARVDLQGHEAIAAEMASAIQHRGPDDAGVWADRSTGIALGHRRLSILDLSMAGHQPMTSVSGRYVIVFNGEIYNHLDLRRELERGHFFDGFAAASGAEKRTAQSINEEASSIKQTNWRGHSDTETLLAGFDAWGVKDTVERCVGMFAFAVWDRKDRQLTLGRDRLGEKPLYYGWQGLGDRRTFLFGSELKSLQLHPSFSGEIDRGALSLLLRHNYIPAPHSIFKEIQKLEPGCLLTVSLPKPQPVLVRYWSLAAVATKSASEGFAGPPEQAVDELDNLLRRVVRQQMIADVPLGAFLSGGVDSSTVVALMQVQSSRPVKTFTIGFNETDFNEAIRAKAVAKYLGTEHTELYVSPREAMDVVPMLSTLYDEPFGDSSQIPTFLVARLAGEQVKVSLSGDGGDEMFGGYNRYVFASGAWRTLRKLPVAVRQELSHRLAAISPKAGIAS